MRLLLCRHAEAGAPAELQRALAGTTLAAVYTSPIPRAAEAAHAVAAERGLTPIIREDLREIELGEVDGLQFEEYPPGLQAALLTEPSTVRFAGGESYDELRTRVVSALADIVARHDDQTVAAVSHAGAIRAALATWLEVAPNAAFRIDQSFAAVNVVDWTDGTPFVRLVNGARAER